MKNSFSGYENYMEYLKTFTKDKYLASSQEGQNKMVNDVFNVYREVNIYPNTLFNEKGIHEEIMSCYNKDVDFIDGTLGFKYNQGSSLCRFLFPNIRKVDCKGTIGNSLEDRFKDDNKLKRAIKFCLEHKNVKFNVVPSALKDGLEMIGGNVATNFSPMKAKALYEKYTPIDGVIYDYACGFGGRMLGALTSKNNYKYFGVEPNSETFDNLNKLGNHICNSLGKENIFKIFKMGSEEETDIREQADFAFSSPPYFTLEKYCNEETQCYIKYPSLEEWIEKYVTNTIKNIYLILKCDRFYAVNISDFNIDNKKIKFVDEWIKISKEQGFIYQEKIDMKLTTRRGNGHNDINKQEGIFVFYKPF